MIEKIVGKTGLRVSNVGLGCNNIGWIIEDDQSKAVVHKALDLGITLFDTADAYGSTPGRGEEVLGKILKGKRDEVVLASKFGVPSSGPPFNRSRPFIMNAIEASLKRLRTDHLDVYMIHWPDQVTPMDETLRALDDIVTSGKAHYLGVSNLPTWKIVDAQWIAKTEGFHKLAFAQAEYSLLARGIEADLIPALQEMGMGLSPFFPLAGGLLSGKYTSGGKGTAKGRLADNFLGMGDMFLTDANREKAQKLEAWAKQRDHSLLDLAMSWLAAQPLVSGIIAGATTPEQVEQNVKAVEWQLTAAEVAEVNAL